MKKHFLFVLCAAAFAGCTKSESVAPEAGATPNAGTSNATLAFPADKTGYSLTKNDEFSGTALNQNLWIPYYLRHRVTDDAYAYADWLVSNGTLKLKIEQNKAAYGGGTDPTSGLRVSSVQTLDKAGLHKAGSNNYVRPITTDSKFTQKFGYFEIRAKLQPGAGHCSTFWLVGDGAYNTTSTGEIDVVEKPGGSSTGNSSNALYKFNLYKWADPSLIDSPNPTTGSVDLTNSFNIYGLEWTPTEINLYLNNALVKTIAKSPQYPMAVFLSLYEARGGSEWFGDAYTTNSAGQRVSKLPYPKVMEVDYFRAYKKDAGY